MDIRLITYRVTGDKPLIQSNPHKMWATPETDDDGKLKKAERKAGLRGSDSECFTQAKEQLYVNEDGQCFHPAKGFWDNLLMACDGRKLGQSGALLHITRSVTQVEEDFVLYDPTTLMDEKTARAYVPTDKWQIDFRRVVNHNAKQAEGGVSTVAIRPKWKIWGGYLTLEVDMDFFPQPKNTTTLTDALNGLTGLLNVGGHYFGVAVCRNRIKAVVRQQAVWSGLGMGRYSVELHSK